ncbi:MAG: ATP-binding protein [Gaiellales bacterium]
MSDPFDGLPAQPEAGRLLRAALERPVHAYLLSGPPGTGKREYADRFAAALLGGELHRVETRTHPDLFVLEPEGAGIRIDDARRLRRDLHLRPFEASRRVYLVLDAHLLRDESANALLKSLEEPPEYGVFVLVSDHAGRMLPTILSRVATVPFRPFSAQALEAHTGDPAAARAAMGNLRQAVELATDEGARERRAAYRALARASLCDPGFDPAAAAADVLAFAGLRAKAESARVDSELRELLASADDDRERRAVTRRFDERSKRLARRAEWDELRLAVDTIGWWYRDVMAGRLGAADAVLDSDPAGDVAEGTAGGAVGDVVDALSVVLDARRSLELNVHPGLALEAMFHRLARSPVETVES